MRGAGRVAILIAGLLAVVGLVALGTWQVHRLAWKRALIAQVDARIHAAPVPAPAAGDDAYLRVVARGRYIAGHDTLVQASTIRGPGWWVLSPLRTDTGMTILINRGYVPDRAAPPPPPPRGERTVTGLLRPTEPGGGFLRSNDPAANRWYSRDVAAIAARKSLGAVRPYFIDADAASDASGQPIGGLTVVAFPNNHLVYAITWYILALMTAAGLAYWIRTIRRPHVGGPAGGEA